MKKQSIKSAEKLFDAVGMIDDNIIAEASIPYVKPKRSYSALTKALALACSLVICVSIGLGVLLYPRFGDNDAADVSNADNSVSDVIPNTLSDYLSSLDQSLVSIRDADEIDLFDGTPMIIWRFEGDEPQEYRTVALYDQMEKLDLSLERPGREFSFDEAQGVSCQVWISYGNGEVISPYLKAAEGNVGYGEIFEYSPECEPNQSIVAMIKRLVIT